MYILQQICTSVNTFLILFTYFFEIQPAVITTFALSDLMALLDDLSLRTDTTCR